MIVFFPEPYPDELVYSLLARYYVKAGYLAFQYAVEDLYIHKYTNPDVEFLNELKPEFLDVIKECCGMEALIQKHTMFAPAVFQSTTPAASKRTPTRPTTCLKSFLKLP